MAKVRVKFVGGPRDGTIEDGEIIGGSWPQFIGVDLTETAGQLPTTYGYHLARVERVPSEPETGYYVYLG